MLLPGLHSTLTPLIWIGCYLNLMTNLRSRWVAVHTWASCQGYALDESMLLPWLHAKITPLMNSAPTWTSLRDYVLDEALLLPSTHIKSTTSVRAGFTWAWSKNYRLMMRIWCYLTLCQDYFLNVKTCYLGSVKKYWLESEPAATWISPRDYWLAEG